MASDVCAFPHHVLEVAAAAREVLAKVTQLHQERPVACFLSIWESLVRPQAFIYALLQDHESSGKGSRFLG